MCAQRADKIFDESAIDYSICTLVTRKQQYGEMIASFRSGGFLEPSCEYLYLDNSAENSWDAYRGYNLFLNVARGKYIILCHQDILLLADGRSRLDEIIAELDRLDPNWGLLGNAGGYRPGELALRISDPRGPDQRAGKLPARVRSLDENFIVVRRSANLALSRDLSGFHFYGTDLCMIGDLLGYTAYVVDFHLLHKGGGICDAVFYQAICPNDLRDVVRVGVPRSTVSAQSRQIDRHGSLSQQTASRVLQFMTTGRLVGASAMAGSSVRLGVS